MKTMVKGLGAAAFAAVLVFALAVCEESGGSSSSSSPKDKVISIAAIQGVAVPVKDGTPVKTITENAQYSGTVIWDGNPVTFAADAVYTAAITLKPKTGYTLKGVTADFFTVAGATSVNNDVNSGVITAVFPSTDAIIIDSQAIQGVAVPAIGGTAVRNISYNAQYSGIVTWNDNPYTFADSTVYTATITLTPRTGYTLQGVPANFFTVAGATSVSNAANSGVITAVFPQTASKLPADKIEYYWVDQHGSLVTTSGGAAVIGAGDTLTITAQDTGYTDRQWYLNGVNTGLNGNTYRFSSAKNGNNIVSLVAEKNGMVYNTNISIAVKSKVTVTFDANGGSGTDSQTVLPGSSITLPSGSWYSNGKLTFSSWNTNSSGTGTSYSAGASYTVTGDVTFYAIWKNLLPSSPTNLIATRGSYGPAVLTWNAVSGATSYKVYYSIFPDGEYKLLADNITKTNYYSSIYLSGNATFNHDYSYKVTAINSYGESAMSNDARAW